MKPPISLAQGTAWVRLRSFDRPALVVWTKVDRVMPLEHGRRVAELLQKGRFVEIADCYTLIPENRPQELARLSVKVVQNTPLCALPKNKIRLG